MTSREAKQLKRELRIAQRARQAKHGSGDRLFVDEVGLISKRLAEQIMADAADDIETDNVNNSECEHCGSPAGTPCPEWC